MESYNVVAVNNFKFLDILGPAWFKPNVKQSFLGEHITIGYELFIGLYPDIQFMKTKKSAFLSEHDLLRCCCSFIKQNKRLTCNWLKQLLRALNLLNNNKALNNGQTLVSAVTFRK